MHLMCLTYVYTVCVHTNKVCIEVETIILTSLKTVIYLGITGKKLKIDY